jgi:hypothetical protein
MAVKGDSYGLLRYYLMTLLEAERKTTKVIKNLAWAKHEAGTLTSRQLTLNV